MPSLIKERVAAIVPALNEEANVGDVLKVLLESKIFDDIILVDDGSVDKTAEIGKILGVTVLSLPKKGGGGKGNAMVQGIKNTNAEIIAFFDADLVGLKKEHVYILLEPVLKKEVNMSIGIRERIGGLPKFFAKTDFITAIGGERAMRRSLFEKIPVRFLQGFAVETVLNYYCNLNKLSVKYVLLEKLDIVIKEKKWGFWKGFLSRIEMIWQILKIRLIINFYKNEFI